RDTVFESQISVDNKGCAATAVNTIVKETLSTGWTPANPDIKTNSDGTDITLVSSTTNLETNVITWTLGTIAVDKYAILTYQIKSPTGKATPGELKFNATWDEDRTDVESSTFAIQTFNFTSESHLEFDLDAVQQAAFPQPEPRSTQINKSYNYSLKVTNIGDIAADNWNITLTIPSSCNATEVFNGGNFNSTSRKITWGLPLLNVRKSTERNFTINCTAAGEFILVAQGIKDNTSQANFSNDLSIGCSGSSCSTVESVTFTKPSDPRYEKLSHINFNITYNWTDTNVTIGQGFVNISDDTGAATLVWQEYSFTDTARATSSNYTFDADEQEKFVQAARTIGVRNYVDATFSPTGNVTVENIDYTWDLGKVFEEPQDLFTKVKVYTYTPLLQTASLAISGDDTQTIGGWGEYFNFSVEAKARFGRNITVIAWHKKGTDAYTQIDNVTCEACTDFTIINFTYDYNGSDIAAAGAWTFKFNATNPDGGTELAGFTYTVEKDDINTTVITPLNDAQINRTANTTFSVQLIDRDNKTLIGGPDYGEISISVSGTALFETSPATPPTVGGFMNRSMANTGGGSDDWCSDTTSFFLGKHAWKGGTTGHAFVKNNISDPLNFTLVGSLLNTLITPNGSTNFSRTETIKFQGSVADDCGTGSTSDAQINFTMSRGT
ncbi:hypothetical protein JYT91_01550, partial [archaeon AH-315-M20]|nr:hypothetical protein [archaeon AH-315-M20]